MSGKGKNDKSVAEIVEVSKKIPCCKPLVEQIEIMEAYTDAFIKYSGQSAARREIECMKVLFPRMFRPMEPEDLIVGRSDVLPIGFGCVTSVGGVGHYCVFSKMEQLRKSTEDRTLIERLNRLERFWDENDTRSLFYNETLTENTIGKFVDAKYPAVITARLSGTYLDYPKLIRLGIPGLEQEIRENLERETEEEKRDLYECFLECLGILRDSIAFHRDMCREEKDRAADSGRRRQLQVLEGALEHILTDRPETMVEGMELAWIYSLLAGVVNYGRIDDYLGDLLKRDLDRGLYTGEEAVAYICSFFKLMEARRTNVNGRVVLGERAGSIRRQRICSASWPSGP